MNIKVLYRGQIKARTGCSNEILSIETGETLSDLIGHLKNKYRDTLGKLLYDDSGKFSQMILVVLNGVQVSGGSGWNTGLSDGDEIILMSPIAGG